MGAFDSYTAEVPCPDCGDVHHISGQTKFFDPDYDDQRWFEPGAALPAAFTMAGLLADDWVRMRPPTGDDARFTLLVDFDEMSVCSCGRWIAPLLHLALRVVKDREDLHDIDFIEGQIREGHDGQRLTRDEVLGRSLA